MAKVIRSNTATGYSVSVSTGTSMSGPAVVEPTEFERFVAVAKGLLNVTKAELKEKLADS